MANNKICCKQLRLVLRHKPFIAFAVSVMLTLSTLKSIRTVLIDYFIWNAMTALRIMSLFRVVLVIYYVVE